MSTYLDAVGKLYGRALTHYYELDNVSGGDDAIGSSPGALKGSGAVFTEDGMSVNGKGYLEIPDARGFSVADSGALSITYGLSLLDWRGMGGNGEYVHLMGKGEAKAHEWVFRHYVKGSTRGEAPERQGRFSSYVFNPAGGLGAGSYVQTPDMPTRERTVTMTCDRKNITLFVGDGSSVKSQTRPLSSYSIVPTRTNAPVRVGTRDMTTGFAIARFRRIAFADRLTSAEEFAALHKAMSLPSREEIDPAPPLPEMPPEPEGPTDAERTLERIRQVMAEDGWLS